jgi:hypothetical protein
VYNRHAISGRTEIKYIGHVLGVGIGTVYMSLKKVLVLKNYDVHYISNPFLSVIITKPDFIL